MYHACHDTMIPCISSHADNMQVKYGNPTEAFMRQMNFPKGRYLTEEWEDPFCEEALRLGVRLDRDKTPIQNQTAIRFAAPERIKAERKIQLEKV